MDVLLVILILLLLYKAKPCFIIGNTEYLSPDSSNAIKGIFIIFVFFRHITSYLEDFEALDMHMLMLNYYMDQLIVVMFLFYSGYGVYYSIMHKEDYMKGFLKKRILKLLIEFDIIVIIYFVVGKLIGRDYSAKKLLLSLAGWSSVGNSNWYIFSILVLYGITLISYGLFRKKKIPFVLSHVILTAVYIAIMMRLKEDFWYNTAFAYVFGIFWGCLKDKLDKALLKWYIALPVFAFGIPVYHYSRTFSSNIVLYEVMSVAFTLLIILVTMRVRIGNPYLIFLGKNLFPLYILQRLPMILLKEKTEVTSNHTVYMIYSAILTILFTYGYLYLKGFIKRIQKKHISEKGHIDGTA